ncbi:MAG: glycosyltransferase family 2 protein [Desulfobacterales bacterium]|nr:glycosyltransferase family 2 protein [Desulfobacterales bacterium]
MEDIVYSTAKNRNNCVREERSMGDYFISIVIPVFNEGKHICRNLRVIREVLAVNSIPHELVIIDDGSYDDTWQSIKQISLEMPCVHAIRLSRNFGKEAALCAGLEAVSGDACVIMDADLQHPPEIIPEMLRLWEKEGYEIVEGVKESRGRETLINKVGAFLFYRALQKLSGFNLNNASDFKLLDSKVVAALRLMNERNTFFRGMTAWVGFKRKTLPFQVADRRSGKSKWSLFNLCALAVTAITSFSPLPLQIITFLGVMFLLGSIILGVQTLYVKFNGMAVSGFTTVILLLLIIGSILMISLGIVGTYIAKIFDEVKFRPRYLIAEIIERPQS